jgi:hypothetical protein
MAASSTPITQPLLPHDAYLCFQTHWDREWYEPFPVYRARLVEVLLDVLASLEANLLPKFTLDGQTSLLIDVWAYLTPSQQSQLTHALRSGQLHVGPWFVMPDTALVDAESLIRNLQMGITQAKQYGCHDFAGYLPDTFGHAGSLPSLFRGFGIGSAIVWRGKKLLPTQNPYFNWQSPNGDSVLAYQLPQGYLHLTLHEPEQSPTQQLEGLSQLASQLARQGLPALVPIGGDHLGLPRRHTLKALQQAFKGSSLPVLHPNEFMTLAENSISSATLPTVTGALFDKGEQHSAYLLSGTLHARPWLKLGNAHLAHRLTRLTEPLLALMTTTQAVIPHYWHQWLEEAWTLLLLNHPHDSICGCSVDEVHAVNESRIADANALADALERRCWQALATPNTLTLISLSEQPIEEGLVPFELLWLPEATQVMTEATVTAWLNSQLGEGCYQLLSQETVLQHGYQTDFRQVPQSHLTQYCFKGLVWLSANHNLCPLSLTTVESLASVEAPPIEQSKTLQWEQTEGGFSVKSPFWQIDTTATTFTLHDRLLNQSFELPTLWLQHDAGDSYNQAPVRSQPKEAFILQSVVLASTPLAPWVVSWQLTYQHPTLPDSYQLTVTLLTDEPLLKLTLQLTAKTPNMTWQWVLPSSTTANHDSITVQSYGHLGWETLTQAKATPVSYWQGYPVTHAYEEWEPPTIRFQAGLKTDTVALWGVGLYHAEQTPNGSIALLLHRGFSHLSGGRLPSRGCPAGPPFETPNGQGLHRVIEYTLLLGNALSLEAPIGAKALAHYHQQLGVKGAFSSSQLGSRATALASTTVNTAWQPPIPKGLVLQSLRPSPTDPSRLITRWLNPTDAPIELFIPIVAQRLTLDDTLEKAVRLNQPTVTVAPHQWVTLCYDSIEAFN